MKDFKLEFSLPIEALEEKKLSSTSIFDGKVLHVRLDEITLPNGKGSIREYWPPKHMPQSLLISVLCS